MVEEKEKKFAISSLSFLIHLLILYVHRHECTSCCFKTIVNKTYPHIIEKPFPETH